MVNDGNKFGIYTPLSWDSYSSWKHDKETFIFNLNKNQKYKKIRESDSIYCDKSYGPLTNNFGCSSKLTMKSLEVCCCWIDFNYDNKASEILPNNNSIKILDLIETEVYKIILLDKV